MAACHGVGARIAPHADIIDVTHLIPPGDIRRGAAVLAQTVPYLPPAVHVAVVDPGVGTARRGIAVAAGDSVFIGPDNGLLSWALTAAGGADRAFSLTNRELWLSQGDADLPRPGHLHAGGGAPGGGRGTGRGRGRDRRRPTWSRCPPRSGWSAISPRRARCSPWTGSATSSSPSPGRTRRRSASSRAATVLVRLGHRQLTLPYRDTFGTVATGELVIYTDSAGLVSVAVNGGNAAQRLGLPPGAQISITAIPQTIHP